MDSITTCGVCLDAFQLDDSAVALPCKHVYHEDCLVPWLKTSGTCPICRYALVPQPGQPGYGEEGQEAQSASGATAAAAPAGPSATGSASSGGDTHSSTSAPNAPGAPPPRPPLSSRPSTAQIPDVEGGSTLPGSWVWPAREESDPRSPAAQNALAEERSGADGAAAAADAPRPDHARDPDEVPLRAEGDDAALSEPGPTGGEESARSAARAAVEAAERRRAAEAEERKRLQAVPEAGQGSASTSTSSAGLADSVGEQGDGVWPVIEDVD